MSSASLAAAPAPDTNKYEPMARWSKREWLICLALGVAIAVVYGFVLKCEFVNYDDEQYILHNPYLRLGLSPQGFAWGLTTVYFYNWHPLVWWSFLLDQQLYGTTAAGFHLTNLLWHLASTLVLFAALRRMSGAVWPSALVSALFALHPLNVQSVAWISERKGIISTFFWMLTLWSYTRYAERPALGRYLLVALSLALGLMAKQMVVTLPCVLLLLDFWPLGRWQPGRRGRLVLEKLPLLALVGVASMVAVVAQVQSGAVTSLSSLSLSARVKNALVAYVVYIGQAIYPVNLAPFYMHPGERLPLWQALAAAAFLVVVTVLVLRQTRRRPYLAVGWLWYLGTLLPVIGVIQVGFQAHADRYVYVPLVGLFSAAAWSLASWAHKRHAEHAAVLGAALVLGLLAITSWVQVHYWENSVVLWYNAIRVTGGDPVAHSSLGLAYLPVDKDAALVQFEKALEFDPNHQQSHVNAGLLYMDRLDLAKAAFHFQQALRYVTDNPLAQMAHLNLGMIQLQQGHMPEAEQHFEAALRINPRFARAHADMGYFLARKGDKKQADMYFRQALELDPNNAATYLSLGDARLEEGNTAEAGKHFASAARLSPRVAEMHLWGLAQSFAAQKNSAAALACLRPFITIVATYAESKDFTAAADAAQRGEQLARALGDEDLARELASLARGLRR